MPLFLKHFRPDQSGQVAVIFAVSLIPICGVAGFCIDHQHTLQRIDKVQAVLDSAVLAAARAKQSGATEDDTKLAATQFIEAQIANSGGLTCQTPTITLTSDDQIQADIECAQDTTLTHLLGPENMKFSLVSASHYTVGKLDVAFIFDASMSMVSDNRMKDLKAAAGEAIDILLPDGAPAEVIANTRVAMASYSTTLNAGPFFEQVTGVTPIRTYYHTIDNVLTDQDEVDGHLFDEMHIGLYDADTGNLIAEIGDGAIIKVKQSDLDDMTIAITLESSHSLYSDVESIRLELSGEEREDNKENVTPFSLYGDSGIANLDGERWNTGEYTIRIRAYDENDLGGAEVFDEELDFKLFKDGDTVSSTISRTIESTCVFGRDGDEKFSDAAPGPGSYLSHQQAWFQEQADATNGGFWRVGYNPSGQRINTGAGCRTAAPVELTNNRTTLINYVASLTTDAYTAGHLGVAWSWYLISDNWSSVFDGTAKPVSFSDPEITKAVILMTDGAFNYAVRRRNGDSDAQARKLCDAMKLKHIDIYSVAFKAPTDGQEVLEYCASNPAFYFNAQDADDLKQAYRQIALSLSDLRLSQ